MKCPLVSIVIPVYNCEKYIKEAIDSILGQDYPRIELIVLDDGSTDSTWAILNEYPESAFYRERHQNMGQAATLNKGWHKAKGEIMGYLSADDVLLSEAVTQAVAHLNAHENAVMVFCDYLQMDEESRNIRVVKLPEFDYARMVKDVVCLPGPGAFWTRAAFEKCDGWNTKLRQIPDFEFWLRLGLYGRFVHIPTPLAKFRVHAGSQTCSVSDVAKSEEAVWVMEAYFKNENVHPDVRKERAAAISSAHIFSASLHLSAGRNGAAARHIREAFRLSPRNLVSSHSIRRLVRGLTLSWRNQLRGMKKFSRV
ncbi:MAG TPA: hypothetical protein DFK12_13865 [Gallionellaceae bacterium]|nr:hypothetical protein [Gallionellaceae bacterium]